MVVFDFEVPPRVPHSLKILAPNDLTPCRMAFYFVSTFAIAQTPTKQPALRLSRTKNIHFAKATFPGFSANEALVGALQNQKPPFIATNTPSKWLFRQQLLY
jgi:hypothetical protein